MLKTLSSLISTFFFFAVIAFVFLISSLWEYASQLPDYHQLAKYEPAVTTRLYAGDGRLLMEYANEKRLFVPVDKIPDVMQITGNARQFHGVRIVSQRGQKRGCRFCYTRHMGKTMLRISQRTQGFIRAGNIGPDILIMFQFLIQIHVCLLFSSHTFCTSLWPFCPSIGPLPGRHISTPCAFPAKIRQKRPFRLPASFSLFLLLPTPYLFIKMQKISLKLRIRRKSKNNNRFCVKYRLSLPDPAGSLFVFGRSPQIPEHTAFRFESLYLKRENTAIR